MLKHGVVRALGTMSGTSLDGVDAAIIETDGVDIFGFGSTAYRAYSEKEASTIKAAFGLWQGDDTEEAAEIVETVHAALIAGMEPVDLIGFHGQTVSHDPPNRRVNPFRMGARAVAPASVGFSKAHDNSIGRTFQIGDGEILANILGTSVVWDFRTADMQLGGQGAPLAPFYHFALSKYIGAKEPVAFLNMGGVANVTWVNPAAYGPDADDALLAFDTGPANGPMNDLMRQRLGRPWDIDGMLAASGTPDDDILRDFLAAPYFNRSGPKSLDRGDFAPLLDALAPLSDADALATATAASALAISEGLAMCPTPPTRVICCGGGRHNPTLMAMISASTSIPIETAEDHDLDGDMIEAQAFAYLAVRVARGLATTGPTTTGVAAAVSGGTLSRPAGS